MKIASLAGFLVAVVIVPDPAAANPRKEGFLLGFAGTGAIVHAGDTGAGFGAHLRAGGLFGEARRFAVVLDGLATQSWHDDGKHIHGAGTLGVSYWPERRLSLSLGAGYAGGGQVAGDTEVGGVAFGSGPAVIGSVGFDVRQWRTRALVARFLLAAGDDDSGITTQAIFALGVDLFDFTEPR